MRVRNSGAWAQSYPTLTVTATPDAPAHTLELEPGDEADIDPAPYGSVQPPSLEVVTGTWTTETEPEAPAQVPETPPPAPVVDPVPEPEPEPEQAP